MTSGLTVTLSTGTRSPRNALRAEASLRRSLLLSLGDPTILVARPISAILLALAVFSIIYPVFKKSKMFRES
jgi:TctA family transporter